jgi:hypothetical protein
MTHLQMKIYEKYHRIIVKNCGLIGEIVFYKLLVD